MAFGKTVVTLNIADASDGSGVTPDASKGLTRNDVHYLERIGERWAKETGRFQSGVIFKVDRLPAGYAGFEKGREGSKHVDRYLWGHPNGVFRSLNEFWPHFTQLQELGGTVGCECVLCTGKKKKPVASSNNSTASRSPAGRSKYFPPANSNKPPRKVAQHEWQDGKRRKQVDDEGTPDLYRTLLDQLKAEEDSGKTMNVEIRDMMSPDWRSGHEMLQDVLTEWQAQPSYVPRLGEVVLFARNVDEDGLAWDPAEQIYLRTADAKIAPKWEAGVVTQMPMDRISSEDLTRMPKGKRGVNVSGFRVEPLSRPSSADRPLALTHKYVALHAMRPFCLLKECLAGREQEDWHPSTRHALTITNSFCVVGRYAFKGAWPEATVFSRGVYIGSELIMLGDVVRVLPDAEQSVNSITDVMVVTSIRLRFVNLEEANGDEFDSDRPYNTALHIVGKAYTLDPKRSYSGTAKTPATLREGLAGYGQFYHMTDPSNDKARLELPFQRILGRCYDDVAARAWFAGSVDLSAGLAAMQKARIHSSKEDSRIDRSGGKSWFWAETRIEQLDLHEINGRFVGLKDESRSRKQLHAWRQALKALDGKRGALEEYHAARKQREEEEKQESAQAPSSAWGLMAASANVDSATDAEKDAEMDGDEVEDAEQSGIENEAGDDGAGDTMELDSADGSSVKQVSGSTGGVVIDLLSDDD